MKKIVIAGGTGLIGRAVSQHFKQQGREVVVLSRSDQSLEHARTVIWDGKTVGDWQKEIDGATVVINLSGYPIIHRWTASNLAKMESSRLDTTSVIAEAITNAQNRPSTWINASAVGFYGDSGEREVSEATRHGEDYMSDLCKRWEDRCLDAELENVRKVCLRLGVVLAEESEFLKRRPCKRSSDLVLRSDRAISL